MLPGEKAEVGMGIEQREDSKLKIGDTVLIRGDLRMNYVGKGQWICAYSPEQLIEGKYLRHANKDRPWIGVITKIRDEMVQLNGSGGLWNIRLLEIAPQRWIDAIDGSRSPIIESKNAEKA